MNIELVDKMQTDGRTHDKTEQNEQNVAFSKQFLDAFKQITFGKEVSKQQ